MRTILKYKNLLAANFLLILTLVPAQVVAFCDVGAILPCGIAPSGCVSGGGTLPNSYCQPCTLCHVFELMENILNFILTCLTPVIAGLLLIVGGFYFFIAGANPQDVATAKRIITAAIIGVVIIFIAWVALNTFLESIGVADWTGLGTWWQIDCSGTGPAAGPPSPPPPPPPDPGDDCNVAPCYCGEAGQLCDAGYSRNPVLDGTCDLLQPLCCCR